MIEVKVKYKNKIEDIMTNRILAWYLPIAFLIFHGFMLSEKIELWEKIATPAAIIFTALALVPIVRERTRNVRTVFLYASGIFVFGIAEAIWSVLDIFFHQNPLINIFLSYLYVIPNLCFFIGTVVYFWVSASKMNYAQLIQDLLTVTLMTAGFVTMIFFDSQIYGHLEINYQSIANFMVLLFDTITMILMITIRISLRSRKVQLSTSIIFIAMITLIIADSDFIIRFNSKTYVPYGLTDWLYMASLFMFALGIKVGYLIFRTKGRDMADDAVINEGPARNLWLLLALPLLCIIICGVHLRYLLYFAVVIIVHLCVSLYIQKNIAMERLLEERTRNNEILQERVMKRTAQLMTTNEKLRFLLQYDKLTGLYSRERFFELMDIELSMAKKDRQIHLIVLDIDKFRMINDMYGYEFGNEVLKHTAKCISRFSSTPFYSARLDGNEFAILCCGFDSFSQVKKEIERLLLSFQKPIDISPFKILVNVHIGVASYPENAENRSDLLKCGKTALQQSKLMEIQGYSIYNRMIYKKERRRQEIEIALLKADIDREFSLRYQPVFDVTGKVLSGMEALLRWESKDLGAVTPDEFIPVAEETGYILKIGEWVMKSAMEQIAKWNCKYGTGLYVGINISPIQLKNTNFIENVKELIWDTGVNTEHLTFEITESSDIASQDLFGEVLMKLSKMGISLAIDDFGTGYASYGYLKKFSIDCLKIDKLLVESITIMPNDTQIVKAIIAMAKALEIRTIAEGVETKEQAEFLREIGCDMIQGYFFGEPVTEDEFENFIDPRRSKRR
ncbi:MAG: bifunctional diguanylate cyclase/phosphodiesterase [Clostridiaceae bacterium]